MLKEEFTERTGIVPSYDEFSQIHNIYMSTQLDKDDFCKEYLKFRGCETIDHLYERVTSYEERIKDYKIANLELAETLLRKAHTYEDTDFRQMAIQLVGETQVVRSTINLGLQLWDEDKEYIFQQLDK